jgi:hypothetical protein
MHNYSVLLDFFDDTPDKTGKIIKIIGKVSFTSMFVAVIALILLGVTSFSSGNSPLEMATIGVFSGGFFLGILALIASGVHYMSRKQSIGHSRAILRVMRGTALYIFLPTTVIAAAIVIWAIMTNQPGVRM